MRFPAPLPHGPLTPVVEGIHVVRGTFRMGPGLRIGRTMTVIAHDGGLCIVNSVRLSTEGEAALAALGAVRHLVKLADAHGIDDPCYLDRFQPTFWAPANARPTPGAGEVRQLGPDAPLPGAAVIEFPGVAGGRECALWLPVGGGTLVTCDALQNHDGHEPFASWFGRVMTPVLGFTGGVIVAPMWRKHRKVTGARLAEAFTPLLAHRFENLITAHGPPVVGGADRIVRAAIERAAAA